MTALTVGPHPTATGERRRRPRTSPARAALQVFLIGLAVVWMLPLLGALYASVRPYSETSKKGFFSFPSTLTFEIYRNAFTQGQMRHYFWNTALILIPALVITLLFSAMVAFVVSRFSWRFNLILLVLFTAGNLLPQQVIIQPLFQMYRRIHVPGFVSSSGNMLNSYLGLIIIHVAFQSGFCTFVLSNYMKTIPKELTEAAMVDGAGVFRQFFQIVLPLCRPALAALATLEFTWIYNDFFWAVVLVTQGSKRPITSSIANLGGQFFSNDNLIAAGSLIIALPTLAVYLILQKQFISGLTLGANKG